MPVAVDIGEINAHRRAARMPKAEWIDGPKSPFPRIDPNSIGARGIVVANIQVRNSVSIEIAKHHRQSPVPVWRNRFPFLVHEHARLKLNGSKMPLPIVAVQSVHFWQFAHLPVRQRLKSILQVWERGRLIIDL